MLIKNDRSPVMFPLLNPYGHVAFQAQRGDVHTVLVNGRRRQARPPPRRTSTSQAVRRTVEADGRAPAVRARGRTRGPTGHEPRGPRDQDPRQPLHLHRVPDGGHAPFGCACLGRRTGRAVSAVAQREVPVLVVGGSLVGLTTSVLLGNHGRAAPARREPPGHRDPPEGGVVPPADDGGLPLGRAAGAGREGRRAGVPCRTAPSSRWRASAARNCAYFYHSYNEGVGGSESDRPPLPHPGRARADPAPERASDLGAEHLSAPIWSPSSSAMTRSVGHPARARRGRTGRHLRLPGRRRRSAQRGPRTPRHRDERPGQLRRLRHHLLQGRRQPPDAASGTSASCTSTTRS